MLIDSDDKELGQEVISRLVLEIAKTHKSIRSRAELLTGEPATSRIFAGTVEHPPICPIWIGFARENFLHLIDQDRSVPDRRKVSRGRHIWPSTLRNLRGHDANLHRASGPNAARLLGSRFRCWKELPPNCFLDPSRIIGEIIESADGITPANSLPMHANTSLPRRRSRTELVAAVSIADSRRNRRPRRLCHTIRTAGTRRRSPHVDHRNGPPP